jgi:hypothetical protein
MSVKEDWPRKYNGRMFRRNYQDIKWERSIRLRCPLCACVSDFAMGRDDALKRCQACGSPLCE